MNAQVDALFTLPPSAFSPPPDVYSTVLRLEFAPRFAELGVDPAGFDAFLRQCFAQKRKTLRNNLRVAGYTAETIAQAWPIYHPRAGARRIARPGRYGRSYTAPSRHIILDPRCLLAAAALAPAAFAARTSARAASISGSSAIFAASARYSPAPSHAYRLHRLLQRDHSASSPSRSKRRSKSSFRPTSIV